ncbi:MAG TPA: hypothetical protein VK191_11710 [Symbiobacteriaceae bacterium]|nr:hypothetical protein [Symbiobacteriaceae bacterium]
MKPILCLEQPGGSAGATLAELQYPAVSRSMALSQAELLGALPAVGLLVLVGEGKVADIASLAWRRAGLRSLVWTDDVGLAALLPLQPYLILVDGDQLGRITGRPATSAREAMVAATALIETGPLVAAVALEEGDLLLVSPVGAWRAVLPGAQPAAEPAPLTAERAGRLLAGLARGLLQELPPAEILRQSVAIAGGQEAQAVRVAAVR